MKHKLLNLSVCLTSILSAFSQGSVSTLNVEAGKISLGDQTTPPNRNITYKDDHILVSYDFSTAMVRKSTYGDDAASWKTRGFQNFNEVGMPVVPLRSDIFYGDITEDVTVEIVTAEYKDYHLKLNGGSPELYDSSLPAESASKEIKPYEGFFPATPVELGDKQTWRDKSVTFINIWPIQYRMTDETVRAYTYIEYKITRKPSGNLQKLASRIVKQHPDDIFPFQEIAMPLSQEAVQAKVTTPTLPGGPIALDPATYMIVTVPKYHEAAELMAQWQRCKGFDVVIEEKTSWTTAKIKESVSSKYNTTPYLNYLLIIGNNTDVPGVTWSKSVSPSDNPYVCMDGANDYIGDIKRGRLAVNTAAEAMSVVKKIINYQLYPPTESSYYNNVTVCAQFDDISYEDGYEDRRFTLTAEEICDYLETYHDKNVTRLFKYNKSKQYSSTKPLYWNNDLFSYGGTLPQHLNYLTFNWNPTVSNVVNAINQGTFLLIHRGHGQDGVFGWNYPEFRTTSITQLSNSTKPVIHFCINCQSGNFYYDYSFAQKLLTHNNGGAVCVVAASDNSWTTTNDTFVDGMVNSLFNSPGFLPDWPGTHVPASVKIKSRNVIGSVFDEGCALTDLTFPVSESRDNRMYYHIFGDPAMKIFTEKPEAPKASVTFMTNGVKLTSLSSEKTEYNIYDTLTKEVQTVYSSTTITSSHPQYLVVTATTDKGYYKMWKGSNAILNEIF